AHQRQPGNRANAPADLRLRPRPGRADEQRTCQTLSRSASQTTGARRAARRPKDERSSSQRSEPRDARAAFFAPLLAHEGWSLYGAPWLQPVAISGKSVGRKRRQKQAKTVAVGCDGKEGVDGSSPSEGFSFLPA